MEIIPIDIDSLVLDASNPRFAELYNGSTKEEDLIQYLLYSESGQEIAKAISISKQFYPDRALWVTEAGNNFLVKDGNRRCAAVKALQAPAKYKLDLPKLEIKELPAIIYSDKNELERRIREEHTASLFKEWDRIAKALEVFRMHNTGSSADSLKEVDSKPSELIKLASFYYAAVKIEGDDFKKLLRRGRKEGGKTIIFERLFQSKSLCGYKFKNKPSYEIEIEDEGVFISYIAALVTYLKENPDTTHSDVDDDQAGFLKKLENFGFLKANRTKRDKKEEKGETPEDIPGSEEGGTKTKPFLERKQLPPNLRRLIDECYGLDEINFANAKLALARVTFECTLKYVIEETKFDGIKKFSDSIFFKEAFYDKSGNKKPYTNFEKLKGSFCELIKNTGKRRAFEHFDLQRLHQIIHNYNVGAGPADAVAACDNLMPLLEFLLQEENNLFKELDLGKL